MHIQRERYLPIPRKEKKKKIPPRAEILKMVRELSLALFCPGSFPVHKLSIHRVREQGCSDLF